MVDESENHNNQVVDSALTDPQVDKLGFAPFAKYLAESISQMNFAQGFVIAIYGSWGSGKSTLLNLVTHYLKQKPENEKPIVAAFNPWLFSGQEDISRRFFTELNYILDEAKLIPKSFKDRIAAFAKVVSEAPIPYAQAAGGLTKLFDDKEKDTTDFKEEVEDRLEQKHPQLIVTIDDIDRLTVEEIQKLFRVLTAFPNFTNVIYLLAFDKEVVVKALADTQKISGEAYLEKIIQVSFDIPLPDRALIRQLFLQKLNAILADTPEQLFNQNHWSKVYFQGIDYFITTLRDVIHLTNNLRVTYPVVKGAVNPADFIAMESLRVFFPSIYNIIYKNPHAFAGVIDPSSLGAAQIKSLLDFGIAQIDQQYRKPVKQLLLQLFPKLAGIWSNTHYEASQELVWRQQLRVCSIETFPNYFRLTIPRGNLSDIEMKALLNLARNAKVFGDNLLELANQQSVGGINRIQTFLEQLEAYTEQEIPLDCIAPILQAFFDVGDQLWHAQADVGMFGFSNDVRIRRIIWQLLRRQAESARYEILQQAIANGKAIATIVRQVVALAQQQGKYGAEPSPEPERLINPLHLQQLEELTWKRVQVAAKQNTLQQAPGLPELLDYWRQWAGEEEVKRWVE